MMKTNLIMGILAIVVLFHVQPGFSQTPEEMKALKEEMKAIKEGQRAIQKDLQDIKGLLVPKPAAPAAPAVPAAPEFKETVLSIEGKPFMGSNEAKLTLIEFFDFQ